MSSRDSGGAGLRVLIGRLLDHRRRLDYLWLAAYGALPIGIAWRLGALLTGGDDFKGYWERPAWPGMVLLLPAAVFALRAIVRRIGPVAPEELPEEPPPVVGLVGRDDPAGAEEGRARAYAALREALLAPKNLFAALLIVAVVHVADMAALGGFYLSQASTVCASEAGGRAGGDCAWEVEAEEAAQGEMRRLRVSAGGVEWEAEKDWSVAYLSSEAQVGKLANLVLVVAAYSVQFALILVGILLVILILRHNLFFLCRIYQRRRVPEDQASSFIQIDLDDEDNAFGFRDANDAFNVQMLALAVAAVFILFTRFSNTGPGQGLFPDVGQVVAVIAWPSALLIFSLPIVIKILPRLPLCGGGQAPKRLVEYLREFLSDRAWTYDVDTSPEEVAAVAARFAENDFWPTGDNRARQLYFLSLWVGLIALLPDLRAVHSGLADWPWAWNLALFAGLALLAWALTRVIFYLLKSVLVYIDDRLVRRHPEAARKAIDRRRPGRRLPIGVFISYRRQDTRADTGRLHDSLLESIDKERVFMDLGSIEGGVDFERAVEEAIAAAKAMLVVIGPQWLTLTGSDGRPRIQNPDDLVHREVALGLEREIRVVPVLVGGAEMPREEELPEPLRKLAKRNAREISDSRWATDVATLVEELRTVLGAG